MAVRPELRAIGPSLVTTLAHYDESKRDVVEPPSQHRTESGSASILGAFETRRTQATYNLSNILYVPNCHELHCQTIAVNLCRKLDSSKIGFYMIVTRILVFPHPQIVYSLEAYLL